MFNWDSRSHIEEMADFRVERPEFIINWIGQAGFVFQTAGGAVICIDPYYSNSIERYEGRPARRMWYNKFKIANFRPGLVLCSHDHLDHTDPETLPLIYTYSDAVFAGPPSSISHMRRMRFCNERLLELKIGEKYRFRDVVYTLFSPPTLRTAWASYSKLKESKSISQATPPSVHPFLSMKELMCCLPASTPSTAI